MATNPDFPPVPSPAPTYSVDWAARISSVINLLVGKAANCMAELTLANGAASTAMSDARLSAFSTLSFMPRTANAAAIAASIWVDGQGKGNCTIHHTNTANTDQDFRIGILG